MVKLLCIVYKMCLNNLHIMIYNFILKYCYLASCIVLAPLMCLRSMLQKKWRHFLQFVTNRPQTRSGFWLVHATCQSKTDLWFSAEAQKRLPITWLDALCETTPPKANPSPTFSPELKWKCCVKERNSPFYWIKFGFFFSTKVTRNSQSVESKWREVPCVLSTHQISSRVSGETLMKMQFLIRKGTSESCL